MSADALALLKRVEALKEGHFLLSSGLHSNAYVQCALACQFPRDLEPLAKELAKDAPAADVVVSPAMGGIIIGNEVARALGLRHIFTERDNGEMTLRRGFSLNKGQRALVVEDVFTTGKSTREVIKVIRELGADVVGCLSIVHRADGELAFGVPTKSLVNLKLETWNTETCPLCKQGIPVVKPGSRPGGGNRG